MDKPLNNPFRFGQIVENICFFDRREEQKILKSDFLNSQNVIVMAPRRYGKSSLIKKILNDLKSNKSIFSIYMDIYSVNDLGKLVESLSQEFADVTKTPLKKITDFFKKWLPHLKPTITIKPDEAPKITFDWQDQGKPQKALSELLNSIYHYSKKNNLKGVIVFDEFQEISQWGDLDLLLTRPINNL